MLPGAQHLPAEILKRGRRVPHLCPIVPYETDQPGAQEFGGAPGPYPHAHGNPPPSHRGYPGRYMPISEAASTSHISLGRANLGTGSPRW
jgi:hypothetical protein